ncbi:MAG: hypothetical protein WA152_02030 [Microgenomates group bacterium]
MDDELKKILEIPAPKNEPLANLLEALQIIKAHEANKEVPIDEARKYLRRFNVPESASGENLGLLIESWIETIKLEINAEHEAPIGPNGTTGGDLESKIESFEKRKAQSQEARDTAQRDVARSVDRKKEIFNEEQKRIQQETERVKLAEEKLKGKKIYATVGKIETPELNDNQKVLHEKLKSENVDELAEKIKDQLSDEQFKNQNEKEKQIFARSVAVGILSQANNPTIEHNINSKILDAVGHTDLFENTLENELIETAKRGSVALSLNERSLFLLGRQTVAQMYGNSVAETVYGPENLVVILTANQQPGSSYEISIEAINTNYRSLLINQGRLLNEFEENERPDSVIYSRIVSFTEKEEANITKSKKPESEVDKINAIIEKFGLQRPKALVFTEFEANPWVTTVLENNNPTTALAEQTIQTGLAGSVLTLISDNFLSKASGTMMASAVKKGVTSEIAATVLGGLNPLQTALVWLGTELLSKIKQWIKKNPDKAALIFGGMAFFGALPLFGPLIALGLASVVIAGTIGVGVTTAAVFGTLNLIRFVWSRIIISLAGPMIILFIVVPVLTTFVLFIINSGAYIVPPSPYSSSLDGGADNPYMLVTKTANPTKLDNSNSNQTVIYVVTVKALKGNLTNVNITDSECNVIKKDKVDAPPCPREVFPEITNESISPNEPHSFSFTGIYDSEYSDSLIYDSITFTATAEDGTEVTTSGSASVCIGECPANCAVVSNNADAWPSSIRSKAEAGLGILSQYQGFTAKACPKNETINLCYKPSEIDPDLYAWHIHNKYKDGCDVYFNDGPFKSNRDELDAAFMITHELTHHIQRINASHFVGYLASGSAWELKGNGLCTYPATVGVSVEAQQEAMAEAAALQVNSSPSWDTCATNYQSLYPKNFIWSEGFMTK